MWQGQVEVHHTDALVTLIRTMHEVSSDACDDDQMTQWGHPKSLESVDIDSQTLANPAVFARPHNPRLHPVEME